MDSSLGYFPYNYYGAAEHYFKKVVDLTTDNPDWAKALFGELESEFRFAKEYQHLLSLYYSGLLNRETFEEKVDEEVRKIVRPWSEIILKNVKGMTPEILTLIKLMMFVSDEGRLYVWNTFFEKYPPPIWLRKHAEEFVIKYIKKRWW